MSATLTTATMADVRDEQRKLAYEAWERATAKVERQLSRGQLTTEQATRRLVELDARLDEELA